MSCLFSIIVPTYNRAELIERCIRSVLSQAETDFELIIVDDGSIDNTEQVVAHFSDQRVKYFKKKNEERAVARNFGLAKAIGRYINYFDSDDILYSYHLSNARRLIEQHENPPAFHVGYEITDEKNNLLKKENKLTIDFRKRLAYENFLSCNSVFLRKDIADKFKFNEDRRLITTEDYELWVRVASKYDFISDSSITFRMYEHSGRSLNNVNTFEVYQRHLFTMSTILKNTDFQCGFKNYISYFKSSRYTYLSLMVSETKGYEWKSISYLWKALLIYPLVLKKRRFWAAIKSIIVGALSK